MHARKYLFDAGLQYSTNRSDDVRLWRGRFVEEFALDETLVSEALAFLSDFAVEGRKSLLPHLLGQRFEALKAVVGANGDLAGLGSRVAKALDHFKDFQALRAFICHGHGIVTVEEDGKWVETLHLVTFRGAAIHRESVQITEDEAMLIVEQLRAARVRLDGQLKGMLATFSLPAVTTARVRGAR